MKWRSSWFALLLVSSPLFAQQIPPISSFPPPPVVGPSETVTYSPAGGTTFADDGEDGMLRSNRNFPNFIGFMSNPLQNIDPRSLTQIWPMFGSTWATASPPIPDTSFQVLGPGVNIALTDRLSVGMNQGGYAFAHITPQDPPNLVNLLQRAGLLSRLDRSRVLDILRKEGRLGNLGNGSLLPVLQKAGLLRDQARARILQNLDRAGLLGDFDNNRDGWLNLGGFLQYTVIEDIEDQFLLTLGMRWEAPMGSYAVFQGRGPVYLAPYLTVGKELGACHVLATAGYEFPAASGSSTSNFFYANLHLDRQCFGWIYPLVEFNWTYHTSTRQVDLQTQQGFIDFGTFTSTGNLVTLAAGANLVLVQDRLEVGAVYTTPIAAQNGFDFNGFLVKMILRY